MLWIWEILPSFSTNFHVLPQFENIAQNSSTLVTLLGFRSFSCLPLLLCEFAQLLVLFDRGYSKVGSTIWTENMFVFSVHVFHVAAQIFCPSGTQIAQCLLNLLSFPIVLVNVVFQSIFVAKWFWANVAQEIFWWPLLCSVSNHVSLQNVLVGKRFWAHIAKCPFNVFPGFLFLFCQVGFWVCLNTEFVVEDFPTCFTRMWCDNDSWILSLIIIISNVVCKTFSIFCCKSFFLTDFLILSTFTDLDDFHFGRFFFRFEVRDSLKAKEQGQLWFFWFQTFTF